ncbi:MAG: helix-hairpin-helix domain-containing protein [Actinomycetota bacterium]
MEWLKQQVVAALSGDQKVSRQLLFYLAALVAVISLILVLVNAPETPKGEFEVSQEESGDIVGYLFVHIVGEVENPGIYQLPIGARLVDAVFLAGGLTAEADNSSINLARELSDGEQIVVYKIGENLEQAVESGGLISINRASESQLETLPGIGPALAARIIAYREANGGFKSKNDLMKVSGIGEKLLSGLVDLITL